jgi:hypothetical protein
VTGDPRVARLRSLDTEATPGPWHTYHDGPVVYTSGEFFVGETASGANAALIAAMRNAWPAMVDLLDSMQRHDEHATMNLCALCGLKAQAVLDTLDPP